MTSLCNDGQLGQVKSKKVIFSVMLLAILALSIAGGCVVLHKSAVEEFYFGVEFAYAYDSSVGMPGLLTELKAMVDEVKDYTNLFVIGTPEISINQTALEEACDYISGSGLDFIVLFTDSRNYSYANGYTPFEWISDAKQRYGDRFLGVYRFDEPGGNQLDSGRSVMTSDAADYAQAAENYTEAYLTHLGYWKNLSDATSNGLQYVTSDYGLYWFDYKGGFDAVFAEFGANQSQALTVGLCRGAAQSQGKDWGTIITWTYTHTPYIEPAEQLYDDLIYSYESGAKYIIVFNYPKIGQYGLLTQDHLDAMRSFWDYSKDNPQQFGINKGIVGYVLPQNYGFGFRSEVDKIWGLWSSDNSSAKIWFDTKKLIDQYGSNLDIVYDDPEFFSQIETNYTLLYFWNQTVPTF